MASKPIAPTKRGIWIAFEGNEGAGKTTQLKALIEYLTEKGIDFITTREPGGCDYSERVRTLLFDPEIKDDPRTQLLLFVVSRRRNIISTVLPALQAGKLVISDRSEKSSFAYQHYQYGIPFNKLFEVNEFGTEGIRPDLTVLLRVDPDTGFKRMEQAKAKTSNYLDHASKGDWLKRNQGYDQLSKKFNNWIIVDANKPKDVVFGELIKKLEKKGVFNR